MCLFGPLASDAHRKKYKKILIVDDNKLLLNSLKKSIKKVLGEKYNNYQIIKAFDGIEALGLFKLDSMFDKSIKYVITDQNMLFMNGIELLKILNNYKDKNPAKLYICTSEDVSIIDEKLPYILPINKPPSIAELNRIFQQ